MLTQNEINSLSLSPTKKDFVQIWNELIEVAGKLSERWDPTSTNESDPGIVILKALAGIADKLNYNIDKNTLEAFMPTAAQEDSMRKLCEMLGYNVKYYQSAQTEVVIKYHNSDPSPEEATALSKSLEIPKFTVITNTDQDVSYFTINERPEYLSAENPSKKVTCMEGQLVKCESLNENYVITPSQISENNRFYLPETQIAENGIFVYNVFASSITGEGTLEDGIRWSQVDNLNVQAAGSLVYKFGFDSYEGRPYIEFPDDYSELFGDGIFIYYTRTSGAAGNISARTLTKLEFPARERWSDVAAESISVENTFAATTGANVETIKQAYNNFKKTIGTFETLVTCRDYMNKIYTMVSTSSGKPLVSNVLVTDIRNDLNRAVTICSCDTAGIFYKETALNTDKPLSSATKPIFADNNWHLGSKDGVILNNFVTDPSFSYTKTGEVSVKDGYWEIKQGNTTYRTSIAVGATEPAINHFDLILYPFKSFSQLKNNIKDIRSVYDASFNLSTNSTFEEINKRLEAEDIETIAHSIKLPESGHIVSINNYLRLNATIATNSKITVEEGSIIIDKIKIALANAFNMRELDFGDNIPFDSIVEIIENSDARIKIASLNEPALYTTFSVYAGTDASGTPVIKEYAVESDWLSEEEALAANRFDMTKTEKIGDDYISLSTFNTKEARELYNKLAVRNVLAGRVPLFDYNNTFKTSFSEGAYQVTKTAGVEIPAGANLVQPDSSNPLTMCVHNDKIYTAQYKEGAEPVYTETYTPGQFEANAISKVAGKDITEIETDCKVYAVGNTLSDVTLASGEFIKFRAPNFKTIKTYPAYVNYHLALNTEVLENAVNADADSVFNILNEDKDAWTLKKPINRWQKLLNYFEGQDYKSTVSQTQNVSAYTPAAAIEQEVCPSVENTSGSHIDDGTGKCVHCGQPVISPIQKGPIIINIDDDIPEEEKNLGAFLNKCGCIKFADNHEVTYDASTKLYNVKANLAWDISAGNAEPSYDINSRLDIKISLSSLFITDATILERINLAVQNRLEELVNQVDASGMPMLPMDCGWTISFDYVGVPFEPRSLSAWKSFLTSEGILDFTPFRESGSVFWRIYGEGYAKGKYILQSSEKLLAFDNASGTSNYFGLLPESRLRGVYLIRDVGSDAKVAMIKNDEEYRLRANEYLYIEYTPSSTSTDGTTQESTDSITEILGEGTIIKPNGFEVGIVDSTEYAKEHTPHKKVTFETETGSRLEVEMQKLNANEQIEVRDFAKVELKIGAFKAGSSTTIYYYKNFSCDELEKVQTVVDSYGNTIRVNNAYTLKDGEYIFYTDQNKSELAYFTTGTEVVVEGELVLKQFETIELSAIFDNGLSEIPWRQLYFDTTADKLIFQEFQYITLGAGDKLKKAVLKRELTDDDEDINNGWNFCDKEWHYCDEVEYILAGSNETSRLSAINTYDDRVDIKKGCGWQISSTLELDVAPNAEQVLRKTNQIETSITLKGTSSIDGDVSEIRICPTDSDHPISFKTNLNCQTSSTSISIDDIYSNPKGLKSFEVKFFTKEVPTLVETVPGKVVPYSRSVKDITKWTGTPLDLQTNVDLWKDVTLEKIAVYNEDTASENDNVSDKALRLPICLLPDTYGVFSIYIEYDNTDNNPETWIEVIPGTSQADVTLFNVEAEDIDWREADANIKNSAEKLMLRPGINCIRVNKTCHLFIKSSSGANGSLTFDELKLVNSTPISFKRNADDAEGLPTSTYGLNVKQLGYLNPNDTTSLSDVLMIDEEISKVLKESSAENAVKKLTSMYKSAADTFRNNVSNLEDAHLKLEKLMAVSKQINEELKTIKANYVSQDSKTAYKSLFKNYSAIAEELKKEKDLLKAIEDDKKLDILEQGLAIFANSFASIEETQQKLLEELEIVKTKALKELNDLSKEAVLDNFNTDPNTVLADPADTTKPSKAFVSKLIAGSKELIESDYNTQLVPLISKIDKIANSADRARLLTVLTSLKKNDSTIKRAEILTRIKQVLEAVNSTELDALLDNMLSYALSASYTDLDAILVKLKTHLNSADITALVSELNSAASDFEDTQLQNIIVALRDMLSGSSTAGSFDSSINDLLTKVRGHYDKTAPVSDITTDVQALYASITQNYKTGITTLLNEIYTPPVDAMGIPAGGLLVDLTTESAKFDEAMKILQTSTNEQVSDIMQEINKLSTTRTNALVKCKEFEDTTLASALNNSVTITAAVIDSLLPHGEETVYNVWREDLTANFTNKINTVCKTMSNAIKALNVTSISTSDICDPLVESPRNFEELAIKIADLAAKKTQETAYSSYISDLGLPESKAIADALSAFENTIVFSDGINKPVKDAFDKYTTLESTATSREKQIALKDLKNALKANVDKLSDVAMKLADILCPSVLSLETQLPEAYGESPDDFYAAWKNTLSDYISALLAEAEAEPGNLSDFGRALGMLSDEVDKLVNGDADGEYVESTLLEALRDSTLDNWLSDGNVGSLENSKYLSNTLISEISKLQVFKKYRDFVFARAITDFRNKTSAEIRALGTPSEISGGLADFDTNNGTNYAVVQATLNTLAADIEAFSSLPEVCSEAKDAYNLITVERQLLKDIRSLDVNRDFYYTAPSNLSLEIELNESNSTLNTLMNPITNYDVNNINNSFVISKLDIEYLDKGLQLARSSRLN